MDQTRKDARLAVSEPQVLGAGAVPAGFAGRRSRAHLCVLSALRGESGSRSQR